MRIPFLLALLLVCGFPDRKAAVAAYTRELDQSEPAAVEGLAREYLQARLTRLKDEGAARGWTDAELAAEQRALARLVGVGP
ncbi:MAG: hypothetical protein HY901_13515 [Deltaproteobacteria bacterium]|nr:hypothetical protein [Deltaproteobacteria bacterium]